MPPTTPVPGAQPWLLGIGNLRGNLLPVIDLKYFLEGERTVLQEGQRVLVVRQAGGDVALTIDELFGQRSFTEEQGIEPGALADGRYAHFVERAFHGDEHDWGVFALVAAGAHARIPPGRAVGRSTDGWTDQGPQCGLQAARKAAMRSGA